MIMKRIVILSEAKDLLIAGSNCTFDLSTTQPAAARSDARSG
jgi:hypothetical protein